MSRGFLPPASQHLRSEPAIVAGIAHATLKDKTTVNWQALADDYDRIREHIEHVVPGFTQYNARVRQRDPWDAFPLLKERNEAKP